MFGDQVSIGSLTPLAIQKYVYFIEINYLRITVILTLKSMEIDKRSNLGHYVKQAATLAITTV